jgi:hypothetical protein
MERLHARLTIDSSNPALDVDETADRPRLAPATIDQLSDKVPRSN